MKLTVQTAVSDRPVDDKALEPWANREVRPVLARLREAANFTGRERQEVLTDGAYTSTLLWESVELPQEGSWSVEARVTASPSGTYAGYGDFCIHGTFISRGGAVSGNQFTRWSNAVGISAPSFSIDTVTRKVALFVASGGSASICRFVALVDVQEAFGP